jgi:hypothetical protein
MDETETASVDFVQLAKFALTGQTEDARLYVARLVRRYRTSAPSLAKELDELLKGSVAGRTSSPLRRRDDTAQFPSAIESGLLRVAPRAARPVILDDRSRTQMDNLLDERRHRGTLESQGLNATRTALFVGPPGVGKTLSARWIATQLELPLLVLDLTAVMSSFLGGSSANLRAALDHAKSKPSVILLDDIDALAKSRGDASDIGELKRLVTVILQEVDEWPASALLLAATNHEELLDRALWRRFDLVIRFELPDATHAAKALREFLGSDAGTFARWLPTLDNLLEDCSYSDIQKVTDRLRRGLALHRDTPQTAIENLVLEYAPRLPASRRAALASELNESTSFSQRDVYRLTGVSRDTQRKRARRRVAAP